jgi:hypothetical protein
MPGLAPPGLALLPPLLRPALLVLLARQLGEQVEGDCKGEVMVHRCTALGRWHITGKICRMCSNIMFRINMLFKFNGLPVTVDYTVVLFLQCFEVRCKEQLTVLLYPDAGSPFVL